MIRALFMPIFLAAFLAVPALAQQGLDDAGEEMLDYAAMMWGQIAEDQYRIDPALVGEYQLAGRMETASGLRLRPDGRFEWFLSVGSLDVYTEGTWSAAPGVMRLVADRADLASAPYRLGERVAWDHASAEARETGENTAPLPCTYSGGPEDRGPALPLDQSVVFQIGFSMESLPLLRSGAPRTQPQPLYLCSRIAMIGADGTQTDYISNKGGYVLARMPDGSMPASLAIENRTFAGKGMESMNVAVPDLEPGLYPLLLDYQQFKPRVFDTLYLEQTDEGFAPYFSGHGPDGVYIALTPENSADGE